MNAGNRFAWIALTLALGISPLGAADLPPAAERFDFQRDIRPILENSCVSCHGPRQQKGGFRLDSSEHLRKGGENGAAFANGKSAEADFIHRVARLDADEAMPPKESQALKPDQVGKLRAWIDAGAPWPEGFVIRDTAALELTQADLAKLPPAANRKIDFVKDWISQTLMRSFSSKGRADSCGATTAAGDMGGSPLNSRKIFRGGMSLWPSSTCVRPRLL